MAVHHGSSLLLCSQQRILFKSDLFWLQCNIHQPLQVLWPNTSNTDCSWGFEDVRSNYERLRLPKKRQHECMHARPDRVVHDQNQSPGPNRSRIRIWTWHFQWFLCQKPVDWLGRAMQTMDPVELKGNHKASALGDQYPSKFGQDWTELYHTCSQSGCTSYHMSHSIRLQ